MSRTYVGKKFSEGTRLMWQFKDEKKLTVRGLATLLGWNPGKVSRYLNGDGDPSVHTAVEIEEKLGIPCKAWTLEPTKEFVLPGELRRRELAA